MTVRKHWATSTSSSSDSWLERNSSRICNTNGDAYDSVGRCGRQNFDHIFHESYDSSTHYVWAKFGSGVKTWSSPDIAPL